MAACLSDGVSPGEHGSGEALVRERGSEGALVPSTEAEVVTTTVCGFTYLNTRPLWQSILDRAEVASCSPKTSFVSRPLISRVANSTWMPVCSAKASSVRLAGPAAKWK